MRKWFCILLIVLLLTGCAAPAAGVEHADPAEAEAEASEAIPEDEPFSLDGTQYMLWRGVRCEDGSTEVDVLQVGQSFPIEFTLSGSGELEPTSAINLRLLTDGEPVYSEQILFAGTDEVPGYDGVITFRFPLSDSDMPDAAVLFLTTGAQPSVELDLSGLPYADEADVRTPAPAEADAATEGDPTPEPEPEPMTVTSTAITNGELNLFYGDKGEQFSDAGIPSRSMPLVVEGIPAGTACLAWTVIDPDGGDWVHWLVTDTVMQPSDTALTVIDNASIAWADWLIQGKNDFGEIGYGGPTPPSGVHTYVITVYALSEPIGLDNGFSLANWEAAAEGRVLATATVTGTYAH